MNSSTPRSAPVRALAWLGLAALSSVAAAELVQPQAVESGSGAASTAPARMSRLYPMIPPQPLEQYARAASNILYGRVARVTPVTLDGGMPHTAYEFEVYSSLKAASEERITIRVAGAIGAQRGAWVDGAPVFHAGEEAVLLTWTDATGVTGILGLQHGAYRVEPRPGAEPLVHGDQVDAGTTLPEFFHRLESVLAEQARGEDR